MPTTTTTLSQTDLHTIAVAQKRCTARTVDANDIACACGYLEVVRAYCARRPALRAAIPALRCTIDGGLAKTYTSRHGYYPPAGTSHAVVSLDAKGAPRLTQFARQDKWSKHAVSGSIELSAVARVDATQAERDAVAALEALRVETCAPSVLSAVRRVARREAAKTALRAYRSTPARRVDGAGRPLATAAERLRRLTTGEVRRPCDLGYEIRVDASVRPGFDGLVNRLMSEAHIANHARTVEA